MLINDDQTFLLHETIQRYLFGRKRRANWTTLINMITSRSPIAAMACNEILKNGSLFRFCTSFRMSSRKDFLTLKKLHKLSRLRRKIWRLKFSMGFVVIRKFSVCRKICYAWRDVISTLRLLKLIFTPPSRHQIKRARSESWSNNWSEAKRNKWWHNDSNRGL